MEKYTRFADKKTGINPFLPPFTQKLPILQLFIRYLVGFFLILIRAPFIYVSLAVLFWYHYLLAPIIIIKSVRHSLTNLVNSIFFRIILFMLGFFSFDPISKRRNQQQLVSDNDTIILSNHNSLIDILFQTWKFSPNFLKKIYVNNSKEVLNYYNANKLTIFQVYFERLSFYGQINMAFNPRYQLAQGIFAKDENHVQLSQIMEENQIQSNGPALLYFEGCLTNGWGLCEVSDSFYESVINGSPKKKFILCKLKYQDKGFFAINTVQNGFRFLNKMMMNFSNNLSYDFKQIRVESKDELKTEIKDFFVSDRCPELNVSWRDSIAFNEYWHKTQNESYTQKKDN